MNPHRLRAYLLLLAVAVIWGIAGPVIKITLGKVPPDLFILYRFFLSTIIALFFFIVKGVKFPKEKSTLIQLFIYCLLNSSISLGLLFWGTSKTSLLNMSLIELFGPLLLVSAGYFFLKDKITQREKVGTIVAFIGALVVGISPLLKTEGSEGNLFGNILIFLALLSGAACGVLAKKLMKKDVSPVLLANLSFVVGFFTILPFVLVFRPPFYILHSTFYISPSAWLGIIYMAIVSGNIAYILNNMGQKTIELSEAAPFAYLYPIFSAILAVTLLGDKLTTPIVIGSLITLIGVVIAETKKKRYT